MQDPSHKALLYLHITYAIIFIYYLLMLRIQTWALCLLGRLAVTELNPQYIFFFLKKWFTM